MQDALLRIRAAVQSGLPCEKSERKSRWIRSLCLRNFGGSNPLDERARGAGFSAVIQPCSRNSGGSIAFLLLHTHAHTLVNTHAPPHTPCANWHAATHRCGFKLAFSFQSQAACLYKHTPQPLRKPDSDQIRSDFLHTGSTSCSLTFLRAETTSADILNILHFKL